MFILFLAAMATVGMIYTFIKMVLDGETWVDIVLSVFDLITIVGKIFFFRCFLD
jgi:hypothetical protein